MKKFLAILFAGVILFCMIFVGITVVNHLVDKKDEPIPIPTESVTEVPAKTTATGPKEEKDSKMIRIAVDEWIGWKSLIDANQGLTTTLNSIYENKGLNVEFVLINDATISSTALINGEIVGAGYTINRYAFLQDRFDRAGVEVCMPFITNYSSGGDGIIANANIKSIKDLIGKKIAVPRFSEAETLLEWLIENSGLSQTQKAQIRIAKVYCETAEDAGKAFFSGNVDAAATWEPYLTQARTSTDSRVLFDTSMSSNLILDGLVFRKDFMDENPEVIEKLIEGALEAAMMYKTEFRYIREFPMFEFLSDEEIMEMTNGARLATWADNKDLMSEIATSVYRDMANIWKGLGETAYPEKAVNAFSDTVLLSLSGKFSATDSSLDGTVFNDSNKETILQVSNQEALLAMTLDIKFEVDSYKISADSYGILNQFAEVAKILNGVYIQIEGNTAPVAIDDGVEFSYKRALSVAKYLQMLGVEPKRIIVVGNGDKNPIADNHTEEGKALNRRTEVFFKSVVGY